jgi:3-oxoacyl-[acyl-carrier protein] reductase
MIQLDFSGRTALVSGAAGGLGYAIAKDFVDAGARVFLLDIDGEALGRAVAALGERAEGITVDVGSPDAVDAALARIEGRGASIEILVNNAGICTTRSLVDGTNAEWQRMMDVNLNAAFYLTRPVAAAMIRAGRGGRIVTITSLAGRNGGLLVSPSYSASKAGLAGFTKAAARQLAPHRITVNSVAPGMLRTGLLGAFTTEAVEGIEASVPLGRLGEVRDVSAAVLFLASEYAAYITGITLDVNGGLFIAP